MNMSRDIKKNFYFNQMKLLLQVLPYVLEEECFALKGGTAINLYYRNMPRISVDIDLNYLPIEPREESLINIESALKRIAQTIQSKIPDADVQEVQIKNPKMVSKLTVRNRDAKIKIEPNLVIRGTVFPCKNKVLCSKAQEMFELFSEVLAVSLEDVFGGKICAALDRQHPRDLYDVKLLFDNEGVTEQIRKAFVIYLASHDRPMHELLAPNLKDFKRVYEEEFQGMTVETIHYDELVKTRMRLVDTIREELTKEEKDFLLSVKKGEPQWELVGIPGIDKLPAIQWKLINIKRMDEMKRKEFYGKLQSVLEKNDTNKSPI